MTLSSCYFCGTAIEEPLSEYPVVPDAFAPSPDEQGTVVLCPSCHRKLSRVMEHVVDAVDDRQHRIGRTSASQEPDSAATSDDARTESAAQSSGSGGTAADIEVDDPPTIDEDAADDLLETGPSNESGGETEGRPDETGAATSADDSDVTAETDAADESSDTQQSDDGISVDDGAGASADGPPQATYNRVVRLLQNREFPVERDEIATVATNAYEIPPEDFDAVIETAVERDVLVEDGAYLRRPE